MFFFNVKSPRLFKFKLVNDKLRLPKPAPSLDVTHKLGNIAIFCAIIGAEFYLIAKVSVHKMTKVRFLSRQDVRRVLPMSDAIEGMKSAYAQLSAFQAEMPLRSRLGTQEDGVVLVMPAYLQESQDFGVKIASVYPQNAQQNLPIIHAMVLAIDPQTGAPLGILEGGTLTAIRTGAGAGAATDILSRRDSANVAIIGSGTQARTQLEAVCAVRDIQQVWIYSPTQVNAQKFAEEMAGQGRIPPEIIVANTAEAAVQDADIVCVATTSHTPVFDGNALKAGTHINGVGSYTPQMQELDEITMQKSLIVVDSRESVLVEAGEIIIAIARGFISLESIHAEIGEVINGTKVGRTSDDQITFFKSVGVAVQDAVSANIALRNAERDNIGTLLDF